MSTGKIKPFLLFQHSLVDYLRVAAIGLIVLLAVLILKLFGNREDNGGKIFKRYNKAAETIRFNR